MPSPLEHPFDYRAFLRLVKEMRDAQRMAEQVASSSALRRRQKLESDVDSILCARLGLKQTTLPGLGRNR
ncbi:MAG: hypothetical protein MSH25_10285 [Desulfovibrio sp.]|uniref:hypothetical protein n=1 Tax=Desulfovibrio sp. TaxID=885 RepID=UPI0025BAD6B1|nr:hypothetical protein [Desulfovibrio sp.]MCI7569727.1 hypothetical protein [Desulfovibrio sp.]